MNQGVTMDFQAWLQRLRQFSASLRELPGDIEVRIEIDPPLTNAACDELAARWPTGIPRVLRELWTQGAARINCPYWWTPLDEELKLTKRILDWINIVWGGVCFEPAARIYPGNSGADPNDDLIVETFGLAGRDLWCNCAVFYWHGDGDGLGLDPRTNADDPAVVYLAHDNPDFPVLAPSFTQFLADWEALCYIKPEHWTLARAKENAKELRSLFRLPA
jgi:hypothetical protein